MRLAIFAVMWITIGVIQCQTPTPTPPTPTPDSGITGTCPQGTFFYARSGAPVARPAADTSCPRNTNTCCAGWDLKAEMATYLNNLSGRYWTFAKIPTAILSLMSHMTSNYGGARRRRRAQRVLQAVVDNKTTQQWNQSNTANQTLFRNAWNAANQAGKKRADLYNLAQQCTLATFKLRSQMACAACNPENQTKFAAEAKVLPADISDFQIGCAGFWRQMGVLKAKYATVAAYFGAVSASVTHVTAQVTALNAIPEVDVGACFPSRRLQTPTPPAPTPSTVTIEVNGWGSWKTIAQDPVALLATPAAACMNAPGMRTIQTKTVFGTNPTNTVQDIFNPWMPMLYLLGLFNNAAGNDTAKQLWDNWKPSWCPNNCTPPASRLRRLQTPTPTAAANIIPDATGVDLTNSQSNTGVEYPTVMAPTTGQVQMDAANLMKVMSFLGIAAFLMN